MTSMLTCAGRRALLGPLSSHFLDVASSSISKDSEEMSNFISIFTDEHGQPPAFDLFESCEQVAKRCVIAIDAARSSSTPRCFSDIEENTPIIRWDDLP